MRQETIVPVKHASCWHRTLKTCVLTICYEYMRELVRLETRHAPYSIWRNNWAVVLPPNDLTVKKLQLTSHIWSYPMNPWNDHRIQNWWHTLVDCNEAMILLFRSYPDETNWPKCGLTLIGHENDQTTGGHMKNKKNVLQFRSDRW